MNPLIGIFLSLSSVIVLVFSQQITLVAPTETILSYDFFTQFTHPDFPSHKIRVKRNSQSLCEDEKVAAGYSGYLDIGKFSSPLILLILDDDKHLFFWWFDSRHNPINDDVIMWLNGGPGCSSMASLLMELGMSYFLHISNRRPLSCQ
jgi:carboxypeptidase C (cathepsin A)